MRIGESAVYTWRKHKLNFKPAHKEQKQRHCSRAAFAAHKSQRESLFPLSITESAPFIQ